jgi:uncharacterized protein
MFDLQALRLQPGDVHRQAVRVHLDDLVLGGERYPLDPPDPEARIEIQAASGGLYLKLAFAVDVTGPCMRCLEDARVHVDVAASEYHDARPEPGSEEDMTSEYLADGRLDVEQWARDSLVFSMPAKVLDRPDCEGLCARCGARLSAGDEHECGQPEQDDRWSKLRELL